MENLISKINSSNSWDELNELKNEIHTFYNTATEDETNHIRRIIIDRINIVTISENETKYKIEQQLAERDNEDIIIEKGSKQYDLEEWITPSKYAKKYSLKTTQVVNNWIVRDLIQPENILKIAKLNIILVRDIENIC